MDLLGAFFFSSVIIVGIKSHLQRFDPENPKTVLHLTLKSIFVGAGLLALVYIGFSYVSSFNSSLLTNAPPDEVIGALAVKILGPYAGIVACAAVALACLTTAIALAAVSAEFIHEDLSFKKIPYLGGLVITLLISYYVSTLNFSGIVKMLAPILEVSYPALILLSILNILHKFTGLKMVKGPVYTLFAFSVAYSIYS